MAFKSFAFTHPVGIRAIMEPAGSMRSGNLAQGPEVSFLSLSLPYPPKGGMGGYIPQENTPFPFPRPPLLGGGGVKIGGWFYTLSPTLERGSPMNLRRSEALHLR